MEPISHSKMLFPTVARTPRLILGMRLDPLEKIIRHTIGLKDMLLSVIIRITIAVFLRQPIINPELMMLIFFNWASKTQNSGLSFQSVVMLELILPCLSN
jgi:hypothetical protein